MVPLRVYAPSPTGPARIENGVVGVVVNAIRSMPGTRLRGNFDARSRRALRHVRVFYARVDVTNVGGTELTPGSLRISLSSSKGEDPTTIRILTGGTVPGCPERPVPAAFDRAGTIWRTCVFGVADPGRPLDIASYEQAPYGRELDDRLNTMLNRYYARGAITWR